MKGKVNIYLKSPLDKLIYNINIARKVTIIKGDSATGKSVLRGIIEYYLNEDALKDVIELKITGCDGIITIPFTSKNWESEIEGVENHVILLDEDNENVLSDGNFPGYLAKSNNYFIIITRKNKLGNISYSNKSVFYLEEHFLKNGYLYNKQKYMYNNKSVNVIPDIVVTEDSNSGFQFFKNTLNCEVISAGSKTRILKRVRKLVKGNKVNSIYIIADGENFGFETDLIVEYLVSDEYISSSTKVFLYTPRSFEYLLLKSLNLFKDLDDILDKTYNFADTRLYSNWERFYSSLLENSSISSIEKDGIKKTMLVKTDNFEYAKSYLDKFFLRED